ncbi:MAG TPA: PilZ domain-containing protein [Candidatus Limnocylindrales bacterium]|nr:PilZ domain-containing protein [Candidatus Limnocylindrales bacterium]
MQKLEKRTSPRQSLQIPLRFRVVEVGATDPELASETSNISRCGLFMKSPLPLKVGSPLSMTLRVPTYLSGSARSLVQCLGRVVHERRLPNGDIGYGVQFENLLSFQRNAAPLSAIPQPPSATSAT